MTAQLNSQQPGGHFFGKWHWLKLAGSLLALCGLGAWFGVVQASRERPALEIDRAALDFGGQWATPSLEWTVSVSNRTSSAIEVRRVRTSCTCVNVEPKSFWVLEHGRTSLSFKLDLTANARSEADEVPYDEEFVLMCGTDSLPVAQAFRLQGVVRRPLLLSPENRQLSPSPPGAAEWSVPISATLPLKDIVARTESVSAWIVALPDATVPERWRLEIQRTAKTRGHFEIPVVLQPEAVDGTTQLCSPCQAISAARRVMTRSSRASPRHGGHDLMLGSGCDTTYSATPRT